MVARHPAAKQSAASARFPLAPTEAEIHGLVSPGAFAGADAWERGKHILEARTGVDELGRPILYGRVLGAWRREDEAMIAAGDQGMYPSCTCGTAAPGELCRHGAALLLHWARHPAAFKSEAAAGVSRHEVYVDEMEFEELDRATTRGLVTPQDQLARMLTDIQMSALRQMAKQRGVKVTAKNKSELVEQLSVVISDPANIAAAIEGLNTVQTEVLVLTDLLAAAGRAHSTTIGEAYAARHGAGRDAPERAALMSEMSGALKHVLDLGLVIPETTHPSMTPGNYVPIGVTAALGSWPDLVRRREAPGGELSAAVPTGLGLSEVMRVVLDAVARGEVGKTVVAFAAEQTQRPSGEWVSERIDGGRESAQRGDTKWRQQWQAAQAKRTMRVRPAPSPLTIADQLTLVEHTGATIAHMDLALRCLLAIGAVQVQGGKNPARLQAREEPLLALGDLPPQAQRAALIDLWLGLPDTFELTPVLGPAGSGEPGQLEFRYVTDAHAWWPHSPGGIAATRRLIGRLIGRLAPEGNTESGWYDLDALLDALWTLDPGLIGTSHPGGYGTYGFGEPGKKALLKLTHRGEWERLARPVVRAILTGAMHWLGLVEIGSETGKTIIFRPRPAANALIGRVPAQPDATSVRPIVFELDSDNKLHATVPPDYADAAVHTLFAGWGELAGASAAGLRYRIDLGGIHQSFQDGMSGQDLIQTSIALAGGSLPKPVHELLTGWAEAYGSVRLYDDLTLIQVNDDILMHELLATSSLAGSVMHVFSPRVAAIDPARVNELLDELARLGHSPRVLEED